MKRAAASRSKYASRLAFCVPRRRRGRLVALGLAGALGLAWATGELRGATPASQALTVEALEDAEAYPEPRAFVRGNNVRIFYHLEGRPVVFQAEWKRARIPGGDHRYRLAELKFDRSPPKLPRPEGAWREATVLGPEEWDMLGRAATEQLTGPEPWEGTWLQLLDAERVLYRDGTGTAHAVRPEALPDRVVVVQRYNAEEFALVMSRILESRLQAAARDEDLFLLVESQPGRVIRFILLDTDKRRCVLLYAPRPDYEPKGGPQVVTSAKMLASLLLESHGVALLKNPVSAVGRVLNLTVRGVTGLFTIGLPSFREPPPPVRSAAGMDLVAWEKHLDHLVGRPTDWGAMRLLINGEEFFPAFQERLAAAQESIDLLVCIFDRDDVAVGVADLLRERSSEVEVRVILDRMNSQGAGNTPPTTLMPERFVPPKSIGGYLERGSAVRVRPFLNPWFSSEHSKVFIIDRQYAFLGGMNIGREYRYEWHDLMVEATGPVVRGLAHDFERSWAHAGLLGDLAYAEQALFGHRPAPPSAGPGGEWVPLRRLYTRTGNAEIHRAVLAALRRAQSHVFIENTYFYDNRIIGTLAQARRRGVDVRIVIPSEADFPGADSSNYVSANYLLQNGVRVYIYPGMTHVKALIVDGWACVGSANFNRLSMNLNQEVNLATADPGIVGQLRCKLFEVDFAKSRELKSPIQVSWTDHVAEYILNQF